MSNYKRNCIVKKIAEDDDGNFEYGSDQNSSMYIRKKNTIGWEPFWENRLMLKKEMDSNIKMIYTHASSIQFGVNKEGEFYKRKSKKNLWTAFTKKEEVPFIYGIGYIIATKANHYWVEYDDTIIKYEVIRAKKKKFRHIKGYNKFVASDHVINRQILEKVVLDNTTIKKAVDLLLSIR